MAYHAVQVQRSTMTGTLHPIVIEDIKVSDILLTKSENSNNTNNPGVLLIMSPEPCLQPEQQNWKQSILSQDAWIPQEAKDKPSPLPGNITIALFQSHP